jgi:hypothetical protein
MRLYHSYVSRLFMKITHASREAEQSALLSGAHLDTMNADYLAGSAEPTEVSMMSPRRRASARTINGKAALTSMRPEIM